MVALRLNEHGDLSCNMSSQQTLETLRVLKYQETTSYQCHDYLAELPISTCYIDHWCRSKMIDWSFQIIDYIKFDRDTVITAISYLDRFLAAGSPRAKSAIQCRREYQLAAMTTLYMAIKLSEPSIVNIDVLVELSQGNFSPEEFTQMEMDILFGLNWFLNGPTALTFLELYNMLLSSNIACVATDKLINNARYQIELSVKDYNLLNYDPSTVAAAAIIYSSKRMTHTSPSLMKHLEAITGVNVHSANIRQILHIMHHCNKNPSLAVRNSTSSRCPEIRRSVKSTFNESHSGSPKGISSDE